MKYGKSTLWAFLLSAIFTCSAVAQPPEEGEGGRGRRRGGDPQGEGEVGPFGRGGGPGGMMRMMPLFRALDADDDGEISASEIENAVTALKTLDKDKDGKLSSEELRPEFGRFGGPGGPGGEGGGNVEEQVNRVFESDKDKDGKLTKEELPERMARIFERADADSDGSITKDELTKMFEARRGGGRGGEGGGQGPGGGRGGRGRGEGSGRPARPE